MLLLLLLLQDAVDCCGTVIIKHHMVVVSVTQAGPGLQIFVIIYHAAAAGLTQDIRM